MRSRVWELTKGRYDPCKAEVYDASDCAGLIKLASKVLKFWIASGMRTGSLLSITRDSFPNLYWQWQWTHFVFTKSKVASARDKNSVDSRTLPSDLCNHRIWPLEKSWIETFILEPCTDRMHKRLGLRFRSAAERADAVKYTGHSARRTYAVYVRCALAANGYDVTNKYPKIDDKVYARALECGGWEPGSKEFWDYSGDWHRFVRKKSLVDKRVISYILSGDSDY